MSLTLWLMTLGSAIIAFAPTYAAIGMAAPLLVILARLIQGFALGGEIGASTSLLLEYGSDKTRGFYGSWQFVSQGLNTVCGSLLGVALAAALSTAALESWGWRVPFSDPAWRWGRLVFTSGGTWMRPCRVLKTARFRLSTCLPRSLFASCFASIRA